MLRGEIPLAVAAHRRIDIENALRLKQEYQAAGHGADERGRRVAGGAARSPPRECRSSLEPNRDIPSFDGLGARLDNATLLREAGVDVIIAQGDPGGERNLRYAAGNAVRNGMSWDDALKAITQAPAAAFGLTDYGTLEAGQGGEPGDLVGRSVRVFAVPRRRSIIKGRDMPLRTREHELRDKYRKLPPTKVPGSGDPGLCPDPASPSPDSC